MPPVAAAAISTGVTMGAAGALGIATFTTAQIVGMSVVSALLSGACMLLQKKAKSSATDLAGTTVTGYGADNPRTIIYGRTKVGGTIFFQHATGTNNEFIHICVVFAGHQVESFETIYFGDYALTIGEDGAVGVGTNSDGNTTSFAGYAYVYKHLGATDQIADSNLIASAPDKWTTNHRVRGNAYLYIKFKYNQDLFSGGLPNISAVIKGKNTIYDPRTATYGYTNNSALCLADYLVSELGATTDEVYNDRLISAANICDETVALSDGSTEPRYTANGSMDTSASPEDFISHLRLSMGGLCAYVGGEFISYAASWRTPEAVGISESDFIDKPTIQTAIQTSDLFNAVKGTYISEVNGWEAADFPSIQSNTYKAQDGGQRLWSDITMVFVSSPCQAQRIAKIELLKARQPITMQVKTTLKSCRYIVGDIIPVNYTRMGWTGKYFEINNMDLALDSDDSGNPYISCSLTLRETASAIYDWSTDDESTVDIAPNTNLPSPSDIPPPTNLNLQSGTSELFVRVDGTVWTRIKATWIAAARESVQSGGYYEIEYKKSSDSRWTPGGTARGEQTQAYIMDVEDGVDYDVRVRSVSNLGTKSVWAVYTNHTVIGKTEAPTNPTGFLVRRLPDGTRRYSWTPPVGVYDLAGYEVRYSLNTDATWEYMDALHSGVLTSSPYESNSPAKGTYRFAIKSVDRSGNYSTTALYITTTLGDARISGTIAFYDFRELSWDGTLASCHIDSGNGDIEADGGSAWDSLTTWDDFTAWMQGGSSPISYTTTVLDIGSVQTFSPVLEAISIGVTTIEYRYSLDNTTWSSWSSSLTDTTARYIQLRASVSGTTCVLKSLTATLNIA